MIKHRKVHLLLALAFAAPLMLAGCQSAEHSGDEHAGVREGSGYYEVAPEWAQSRVREIDALLAAEGELPATTFSSQRSPAGARGRSAAG